MTTEKLLDKLAKMKRMAEGAKAIGSEAEAQAFADMLQKMLLEHKLEMSDLEFEQMEHEQPIERHMVKPKEHGYKFTRQRIDWQERLAGVVARANFCRILVHPGTNFITLVGRREDIAVAEYLYVTLVRAAEKIATLENWRFRYEQIKIHGKRGGVATHGFKASFLDGFISRLADRFEAMKNARVEGESTALVRVKRSEQAVNDFVNNVIKPKTGTALSRETRFHQEGLQRGRAAADRVNLDGKAIEHGTRQKQIR